MSGNNMDARRQWWMFFVRPVSAFRKLYGQGPATFNLLAIFLAGIVLVQLWATFFHLGDKFETGKIMTLTLILGPVTGLLLATFGAAFAVGLGNLLDPSHHPEFRYREYLPPLPLRRLLWRRIFGEARLTSAFRTGPLRFYARAWSRLRSGLNYLRAQVGGGKASFGLLFSAVSGISGVFLMLAAALVVELALGDGSHFSSLGNNGASSMAWLMIKALFPLWFFALWYPMIKEGFQLSVARAVLATVLSAAMSLGLCVAVLSKVFSIPVFGG